MDAIGLERGRVRVSPYRPEWGRLFAREAELLRSALGAQALRIEHVGSTAIEGMAAKPIIDSMVGIEHLGEAPELAPALRRIGYEPGVAREQLGAPEPPAYLLFVKGRGEVRTHHLRLTRFEGADWADQLLFRDYLRAHPESAAEYAELKRELAERHPDDRAAYTAGKEGAIRRILDLAGAGAGG